MGLAQNLEVRSQSQNSKLKTGLRERCYAFSLSVIRFLWSVPEDRVHRVLSDQLLRSATSIGANVWEAKAASSKREFMRYYEIALESANETAYWLELTADTLGSGREQAGILGKEAGELQSIIAASLLTMKNKA